MPEASKAQKATMDKLGIRYKDGVQMREASNLLTSASASPALLGTRPKCADCDQKLTATEELSLMPDGTTAGTYPKRPVCHHCESGYKVQMEKDGY